MFSYNWNLKDGYNFVNKHNHKVFSCFACGGGSTMGYKMAGYDVLGCCEIDPKIINIYRQNHNPKYSFLCDIRDFINKNDIPQELFDLDILDGSPPCSTFSIAGSREEAWGKEKVFREGQAKQTLDDLFFYFIKLAQKLKPKIVVSENVKGLILGNAKGYLKQIMEGFNEIGYETQIFLLNGATMGLPQARERVFLISKRKDLNLPTLKLNFNEKPIHFSEIKDIYDKSCNITPREYNLWNNKKYGECSLADTNKRVNNKCNSFSSRYIYDNKIAATITANDGNILFSIPRHMNKKELCLAGSFPLDYNFVDEKPQYLIGMSVPPLMMAKLSYEIYKQLLK